jgi:di/tricarboxylate transporter
LITEFTTSIGSVAREQIARRAQIGRILCLVAPLVVLAAPLPVEPLTKHALAITSAIVLAWMTEATDPAVVGLIGCYLYWALGLVPFGVAFSGFANETAWFAFGATLFGAMTVKSGLGRRLAFVVLRRTGGTYPRILMGLIITSFMLTFVVPSGAARVVIMATVALGLVDALGVSRGDHAARGMFVIITYSAGLFDKMIIAGTAVITAQGLMERVGGVEVLWSRWLLAFLPASVVTVFTAWLVTLWLHPAERGVGPVVPYLDREAAKMASYTAVERKTALLMLVAVALWATDFLHDLSPPMIGLGVGLCALLPGVGVLTAEDVKRLNYLPVFFVAAAISMGEVLTQTKGLDVLTNTMFAWMGPLMTNPYGSTAALYWSAFAYHLLTGSEVSMLGTSIPPLMRFAMTHGLDPLSVGMIWTFAAGGKIFVYQSAVLVIGHAYGFFDSRDLFRIGLWLTLIEFVVVLLLRSLYWPLLGLQ